MSNLLIGDRIVDAGDLLYKVKCKLLVLSKLFESLIENESYEFGVELFVADVVDDIDQVLKLLD